MVLRDHGSPIVFNNIIEGCSNGGIAVENGCTALIVNNVIYGCGPGVKCFDLGRWDPPYSLNPGGGTATVINCIIRNWIERRKQILRPRPKIGNSSLFRFEAGRAGYICETFRREIRRADDRSIFPTEQSFLTYAMRDVRWWPEDWVASFKYHCRPWFPLNHLRMPRPPAAARILVFHGHPDPDEALSGFRGKHPLHRTLPAPWIAKHWRE